MITQNKIITASEQLGWTVNIKKQKANKYHRQWYVSLCELVDYIMEQY